MHSPFAENYASAIATASSKNINSASLAIAQSSAGGAAIVCMLWTCCMSIGDTCRCLGVFSLRFNCVPSSRVHGSATNTCYGGGLHSRWRSPASTGRCHSQGILGWGEGLQSCISWLIHACFSFCSDGQCCSIQ